MPTGVPLPDVRDQLFAAAERILVRGGPAAFTSRAVTIEAGVAKGVLHRHFDDFDTFVAALAATRLDRLDRTARHLREGAGTDTVVENLARALAQALSADVVAIVALVLSRPRLWHRLRLVAPTGIPLLSATVRMIAAYLTAERGLGRVASDTAVDDLALALVGGAYLLAAGRDGAHLDPADLHPLTASTLAGVVAQQQPPSTAAVPPGQRRTA